MQYITEYNKFKSTQQKIDDLVYAAGTTGNVNIIDIILDDIDKDAINMKSTKGEIALNVACRNSRKEIVQKLLDAGADVNAQDKDLNTPLMKAIYNNDLELVDILIKANANINLQNKLGKTALMLATTSYNRSPNIPIIKKLLDMFPDVFLKDSFGEDFVSFVKSNPVVADIVEKEYAWLSDSPKFGL